METLKYKGFIGSIEAELKDNTLYGKVLGMDKGTLITYEGNTLAELRADFEAAIDDYIAYCKEENLPLHKSYSGTFNIRISPELHAKAAMSAQSSGMSLNAYIQKVLAAALL
ncbi:MAG: type II toxin-antitoxin system HicB family antitoxin [Bacteroidales bacterium]|nr:type II toxin-antitoxin system HicB family antitoxin [Bacteroidales bacterium]